MPKKRLLAVVVGVSFLVVAGVAGAVVVKSLPGGTVIPMPNVGYFGPDPQIFDGITWTATTSSVFGWTSSLDFAENGGWTGSLGPYARLQGFTGTMTFEFNTPVSGVGGFMNHAAPTSVYGIPVISIFDSSNTLIESTTWLQQKEVQEVVEHI